MCFSIPLRVILVNEESVLVEGGKRIKTDKGFKLHPGDYLQLTGNLAVNKLSAKQGLKIRKLVKKLNP